MAEQGKSEQPGTCPCIFSVTLVGGQHRSERKHCDGFSGVRIILDAEQAVGKPKVPHRRRPVAAARAPKRVAAAVLCTLHGRNLQELNSVLFWFNQLHLSPWHLTGCKFNFFPLLGKCYQRPFPRRTPIPDSDRIVDFACPIQSGNFALDLDDDFSEPHPRVPTSVHVLRNARAWPSGPRRPYSRKQVGSLTPSADAGIPERNFQYVLTCRTSGLRGCLTVPADIDRGFPCPLFTNILQYVLDVPIITVLSPGTCGGLLARSPW